MPSAFSVFRLVLLAGALLACGAAHAQDRQWKIGVLGAQSKASVWYRIEAFQKRMTELGYREGRNVVYEYRYADGRTERNAGLARELVAAKSDLILALGLPAAIGAKQVTTTLPVVFTGGDPVRAGLVKSLARPGGNVTGLADSTVDVSTKRLELLKQAFPRIARVAMLWNPANPTNPLQLKDTQAVAPKLGVTLQAVTLAQAEDIERAFGEMKAQGAEAILIPGDPLLNSISQRIKDNAIRNRLPTMYALPEHAYGDGLLGYGTNLAELAAQAAVFVDKILKGAKPGDLPIEHPSTFELVVNLKTAKRIGVEVPAAMLQRADRVIR
jgi:ABC-type uncharacterized transport system substrate-binding protein